MTNFANYKNGQITVDTYRLVDAVVTDIADILEALESESDEILTASINTDAELTAVTGE